MISLLRTSLVSILFLSPCLVQAQALTVLGGNEWARACFDNAEFAAENLPALNRMLLKPCDSAINFGSLSLADKAATYANRGIILAAGENLDSAMADYDKALSIKPDTPEIYVNRGNAFFLGKDYAMAMMDYEQSVSLGIRQLHFVRYNMGMTHEKLGNDTEAETLFRSALEIEPGWALGEQRLARLLERQNNSSR